MEKDPKSPSTRRESDRTQPKERKVAVMMRFYPHIFAVVVPLALSVGQIAAQERIYIEAALSSWDGRDVPEELYGFRSVREAEDALVCILNEAGLNPTNFVIAASNVANAAAATLPPLCGNATVPCERALLYNPSFMQEMRQRTNNEWSWISILAHEVGHHLEAHTIRPGGSNPPDELEADEYSGYVLRKLGASLADAQAAFRTFSPQGSATHPPRDARLVAVANGWTRADGTGDGDTSCLGIATASSGLDSGTWTGEVVDVEGDAISWTVTLLESDGRLSGTMTMVETRRNGQRNRPQEGRATGEYQHPAVQISWVPDGWEAECEFSGNTSADAKTIGGSITCFDGSDLWVQSELTLVRR